MEKAALFEIGATHIRLSLSKIFSKENFSIYKEYSEPVHINKYIESDGLIKSSKIKECVLLLQMYKKICEAEGVTRYMCVVSRSLADAKNCSSILDEAASVCGLECKKLTREDEVSASYSATVNTLDVPKGLIVNISSHYTTIIHYNRRVVLDSATIPVGAVSLMGADGDKLDPLKTVELFKTHLAKDAPFLSQIDQESVVIGVGDVFVSMSKIARKMNKHPLNLDHNYSVDREQFTRVFDLIKGLDVEKRQKLRGISEASAEVILSGLCIIDAILQVSSLQNMVISSSYRNVGLIYNTLVPSVQDRPLSDILGVSLECTAIAAGMDVAECEALYELSLMLFKQLRVLHKLPRVYAKILRTASYLYHIGDRISSNSFEKVNYTAILTSKLYGLTHKEHALSAFAASFSRWEDFNLAEWVRYKDLVTQDDLEAVRKISVIIAMADALNIRKCKAVRDISCDVLGDSVIVKLVSEDNLKFNKVEVGALVMEIFYAKKHEAEFVRAFKKNIEIL